MICLLQLSLSHEKHYFTLHTGYIDDNLDYTPETFDLNFPIAPVAGFDYQTQSTVMRLWGRADP